MPAVTRIGDADVTHCSGMTRAVGSGNVFANGIGVSRQGDVNTTHLLPGAPCPPHAAAISSGSSTVKVKEVCFVFKCFATFSAAAMSGEPSKPIEKVLIS